MPLVVDMTLRWEDMTLRDEILEGQNGGPCGTSKPGTLKKDSPEKMLSNGTIESETEDCNRAGSSAAWMVRVTSCLERIRAAWGQGLLVCMHKRAGLSL